MANIRLHAKFHANCWNRFRDMASFDFFKMSVTMAADGRQLCVNVPNFVPIDQAIVEIWPFFIFFKMVAVCHTGFALCDFGPPTKSIWWSLSLCKIWLDSVQ